MSDAADIIEEYEQHFSFKLADGYSEEEIAARLGDPEGIAAQYDTGSVERSRGKRITVAAGLGVADFFFGILCILLFAWEAVLAALVLSCSAVSVCLIGNLGNLSVVSIPPMPYYCSFIFGLIFILLAILAMFGAVYFFGFIRQLIRSFGRFHKNTLASASGRAMLPSITVYPQFPTRIKRILRKLSLFTAAAFAVCFIIGFVTCILSTGTIEFWHAWGWFQNV
ncbi:MAG: DUF1700 domain-containing protein [Clostridia bacterium]|nr:DUF1700 domain-containing protein [Clostridia bacterium]